jgi:uncharacterized protein YndB with AHSA1/START domain
VISISVRIAAPPEVVFPYFTDPRLMVMWLGERAELNAQPGGAFAVDFGSVTARGTYVAVEPPYRVVFTWGILGDAAFLPGTSTVEVVFIADDGDTIVTLTHRDVPAAREPSHREGWERRLGALVSVHR